MSAMNLAQLLQMGRPQTMIGTQTSDQVNADANRAQQWAMSQANIASDTNRAERDFWARINEAQSREGIARMQGEQALGLSSQNNTAEMERLLASLGVQQNIAGLNADTSRYGVEQQTAAQRYGVDANLQGQLAGYDTQRDVAGLNSQTALQQALLGAQTQMGLGNLNAQTSLAQTSMPLDYKRESRNQLMPLLTSMLGGMGYSVPQQPQQTQQSQGASSPLMNALQPQGASPQTSSTGYPSGLHGYAPAPMPTHGKYLPGTGPTQEPYPEPTQQSTQNATAASTMGSTGTTQPSTGLTPAAPGGGLTNPGFPTGPLFTPQHQDQMLNNALAGNAQTAASTMNNAKSQFSSRGWAPSSPALGSMQARTDFNRMNADTTARYQIPMQAHQANQNFGLQSSQAANQAGIGWQNARTGAIAPLFGALAGAL